jgi:hypothetical protein
MSQPEIEAFVIEELLRGGTQKHLMLLCRCVVTGEYYKDFPESAGDCRRRGWWMEVLRFECIECAYHKKTDKRPRGRLPDYVCITRKLAEFNTQEPPPVVDHLE